MTEAESLPISLDFIANTEQATNDIKKMESEMATLQKYAQGLAASFEKKFKAGEVVSDEDLNNLRQASEAVDRIKESQQEAADAAREQAAVLKAESRETLARVKVLKDSIGENELAIFQKVAGQIENISRLSIIAGTTLAGGIFGLAAKYVKDATEATAVTEKWNAATAAISKSTERIGAVAAEAVLPLLEKAAELAEKGAAFVEKNPDLVKAALNTGVVLASLGTIGVLVSQGIKLVVDVKYLLATGVQLDAAKLQDAAAAKQLLAAQLRLEALTGEKFVPDTKEVAKGAGFLGGTVAPIAVTIVSIAAGALAGLQLGNAINKKIYGEDYQDQGIKDIALTATRVPQAIIVSYVEALHKMGLGTDQTVTAIERFISKNDKLNQSILGLGDAADKAKIAAPNESILAGSTSEKQVVDAYTKMIEAERAAVDKFNQERAKIISDEAAQEQKINQTSAANIAKINADAAKQISTIIANSQKEEAKAAASYAQQRMQVVKQGGLEIERLEQDHQKRLFKLTEEHNQNVLDAADNRDAFALDKEQRRFEIARRDEEDNTNQEIGRRREDLAIRLQDMAQQYAIERAQRVQALQDQIIEAQQARALAVKQAIEQRNEELKVARAQRDAALKEIQINLEKEQAAKRAAFIASVRDLNAALLGEQKLKNAGYTAMLTDAQNFITRYRATLSGGLTSGTTSTTTGGFNPSSLYPAGTVHDYSGYAYTGNYRMAQNGQPQYVLSGAATQAAERMAGGSLSQANVLGMMGGQRVTLNQNINFSGVGIKAQDKADMKRIAYEATMEALTVALKN